MRSTLLVTLFLALVTAIVAGCDEAVPPPDKKEKVTHATAAHGHSHAGDDALVWVEDKVEHAGFVLALGHHGSHLHAVSFVEPAVSIVRDGEAVADAKVYNSLIAADGSEVIREEVATIYEPATDDEPAHYAQGKLHLPKGAKQFIIRFRIVLPGVDDELVRDITIDVAE